MSTPGMIGFRGKWPLKKNSSGLIFLSAIIDLSGTNFVTLSTNKNGGRWGRIAQMSSMVKMVFSDIVGLKSIDGQSGILPVPGIPQNIPMVRVKHRTAQKKASNKKYYISHMVSLSRILSACAIIPRTRKAKSSGASFFSGSMGPRHRTLYVSFFFGKILPGSFVMKG